MQFIHSRSRSSSIDPPPLPARAAHVSDPPRRLYNPMASAWSLSRGKRFFDVAFALAVILLCAAPMLFIALCIRLTSPGPALFRQKRVGRKGEFFSVLKFRSMHLNSAETGIGLTRDGDGRVTALGRWLRRLKLDELPQFFNVLHGEMSIVGPRPKLPQYAGIFDQPYRPGITGAATLAFRREEEILSHVHPAQMEDFYQRRIKPIKARIDARYMCRATLASDLRIVAATFFACVAPPPEPAVLRNKSTHALGLPPLPAVESASTESIGPSN
jgi:lipopolysaccharide/colanic/teichoic acid biosynthesis glycosyltransferase